jgi:hypothetical protein
LRRLAGLLARQVGFLIRWATSNYLSFNEVCGGNVSGLAQTNGT